MANNPDKLLADFLSVKEVLTTIAIRIEDNLQEIVRDLKHVDRVQSRIKEEGSFLKKALKKEKDKWKYKDFDKRPRNS